MIPNDNDNCQASNENELDELLRAAKVYTEEQADDAQTDAQTDQVDGAQEPTRTYSDYRSIVDWFKLSGIALRRNLMTDDLHLGNEPINDYDLKEIRSKARDAGIKIHPLEDAIGRYAKANAYHPIRDYFDGLTWDGADHVGALAACIQTPHPAIVYKDGTQQSAARAVLLRWLLGAVRKVFDAGAQSFALVFVGGQGIGKSQLARWLCFDRRYFSESRFDPEDRELQRRLSEVFVWELGELGKVTGRADRRALKAVLSQEQCRYRLPYGRTDSVKPVLTSFVGGSNNESDLGFLDDPSGNRRYVTLKVDALDWSYSRLDINQVWAQAATLYRQGVSADLAPEERAFQNANNSEFETESPVAGWILRWFEINPTAQWMTATSEVVSTIESVGYKSTSAQSYREVADELRRRGLEPVRLRVGGQQVRGYRGIRKVDSPIGVTL
mgnify:CR=1 FL=1